MTRIIYVVFNNDMMLRGFEYQVDAESFRLKQKALDPNPKCYFHIEQLFVEMN